MLFVWLDIKFKMNIVNVLSPQRGVSLASQNESMHEIEIDTRRN